MAISELTRASTHRLPAMLGAMANYAANANDTRSTRTSSINVRPPLLIITPLWTLRAVTLPFSGMKINAGRYMILTKGIAL